MFKVMVWVDFKAMVWDCFLDSFLVHLLLIKAIDFFCVNFLSYYTSDYYITNTSANFELLILCLYFSWDIEDIPQL